MLARLSVALLSLALLTGSALLQNGNLCKGLDKTKCMANSACTWKDNKQRSDGPGRCAGDKEKFCKDVVQAGGHVTACLKQHESELSPDCKAKLEGKKQAQ